MDQWSSDDETGFDNRQNWDKLHEKEMKELDKKRKNWGKNRDAYYNSDTQYFEVGGEDEEAIEDEEEEVKRIQQEQAALLNKMDMGLDAILGAKSTTVLKKGGKAAKGEKVGGVLSVEQRVKHVLTVSPELLGLLSNFLTYSQELMNILPLLIDNTEKIKTMIDLSPVISLIKVRQQMLLSYCTCILYYLYLKTMGKATSEHPVMLKLLQIQTLLDKQTSAYTICRDKLLDVAAFVAKYEEYQAMEEEMAQRQVKKQEKLEKQQQYQQQKAQKRGLKDLSAAMEDFDPEAYYNSFVNKRDANKKAREELYARKPQRVDISSTVIDEDARRGTGLKILENTGLRRQKSRKQIANKHTRHKLRSKHDQALIKRKSQVREYKGQRGTDYTGEGVIKKGLIRSVNLSKK